MGHRIYIRTFRSREEAERAKQQRGQPGYSEVYHGAIVETRLDDGTTGYRMATEEYYG